MLHLCNHLRSFAMLVSHTYIIMKPGTMGGEWLVYSSVQIGTRGGGGGEEWCGQTKPWADCGPVRLLQSISVDPNWVTFTLSFHIHPISEVIYYTNFSCGHGIWIGFWCVPDILLNLIRIFNCPIPLFSCETSGKPTIKAFFTLSWILHILLIYMSMWLNTQQLW